MDSLKIRELFIFNTKLKSPKKKPSDDEAQDAKLLYYYPEDTEILVKRSNIGIVEGTLSFMQAFEKVDSNYLYTELNKTYFIADGFEEDFMIGFILDKENSKTFNKYENLETKKKWLKELLHNFYNTFLLFHNKLSEFFLSKENPYVNLGMPKEKQFMINDFVKNYFAFIESLKIPIIDNLQYFYMNSYLESGLLLAIQRLKEKMPHLKMTSIIYKGKLLHNQLPFEAISILYNIFFSSYECTAKYNTFSEPSFDISQQNKLKEENINKNEENKKEGKNKIKERKKDQGKKEQDKKEQDKKEQDKKDIENKEQEKKDIENKEDNKNESKEGPKEEMKENENKDEKKEENNEKEIKEENKNEIKEENKNEINEENKIEKKEEGEKEKENTESEQFKTSSYRKIFNIKDNSSNFLTGIVKNKDNPNNYNIFVPNIYIKELETDYQMIIYLCKEKGTMFFFFFDKDFEIIKEIEQIEKMPKRINKYFKDEFELIHEIEKTSSFENYTFCYKNSCNKSIKFSGFLNKKNNNAFDWKLFENLQKSLLINGETEMNSLTKYKGGYYIYYIHSVDQEVVMFFKDNLTLSQVKQEVEKTKKAHFDNLFLN